MSKQSCISRLPTVMAARPLDLRECRDEGYSEKTAPTDEVDAAKSLEVVRDAEIPLKYFRNKVFSGVQERFERISERPPKYRLIQSSWGHLLSDLVDTFGPLGLITLEEKLPSEHKAQKVTHDLITGLSDHRLKPFRWYGQYILLWFGDKHGYSALGSRFVNGELERVGGVKIVKIEPALLCNPSKCFIEIEAVSCEKHFNSLMPPLLPFSGAFTFARLRENENGKTNGDVLTERPKKQKVEQETPALCLTLMFVGSNQALAARSLQCFSGLGWQPLVLPGPVAKALEDGLHYFVHESLNLPLVGVRTGASQPGVQLTLFVQSLQKFPDMERFYKMMLGVEPYERQVPEGSIKYSVFPISRQAEFVLAHYPGLIVSSLKNAVIYIQVNDVESIQGIIKICSSYWHINDPECNRVVLFKPLR